MRGAAQVYVKAETGMFVFVLKAVQIWTTQPDLYCSRHMLYVQPVANFIPEARLQNMLLVQSDFVLLPNKEQAHCLFSKSKIYCKKQHNTKLRLHGLNIKQSAEAEGKISVAALALSQAISITVFPARRAAYYLHLLLMKSAVTFLCDGKQMEP